MFSFALAAIGFMAFWPPQSAAIIGWLIVWTSVCLATGIAILRRARQASALVWALILVSTVSAVDAYVSGMLRGIGIVIDIALFAPLIWFAVWFHRNQRSPR